MTWVAFITFAAVTICCGIAISFYFKFSKKAYINQPNEARFVRLGYQYRDAMREKSIDTRLAKLQAFESDLLDAIEEHEEMESLNKDSNVSYINTSKSVFKKVV
jgi:hypothetical protein